MANTFSCLFIHFVFSTKYRRKLISDEIENRVWDYFDGVARKNEIRPVQTGGIEDHLHSLLSLPPKISVSDCARIIKSASSRWIREELGLKSFGWQDGYAAFSVSPSLVQKTIDYIQNQRIHHEGKSFEEEYRRLIELHGIDISDEKYLFD